MRRVRSFIALSVVRSFQYVSDLVNGLVSLMNSNYTLPVNIGNPDEHTISTFAHLIRFAFSLSHVKTKRRERNQSLWPLLWNQNQKNRNFLP
jgi:nucleoside-diphosphate-sugar epimerase